MTLSGRKLNLAGSCMLLMLVLVGCLLFEDARLPTGEVVGHTRDGRAASGADITRIVATDAPPVPEKTVDTSDSGRIAGQDAPVDDIPIPAGESAKAADGTKPGQPSAHDHSEPVARPVDVPKRVLLAPLERNDMHVATLCEQIGNTLGSVSVEDCLHQNFRFGGGFSINQRPLVIKELPPERHNDNSIRVFLMGGIHGDEYSSISIIFKWLEMFSPASQEGGLYWRFAPLVNPDGLLGGEAQRQNANGVDLNRNFPSLDWANSATDYWEDSTGRNPRRFPGESAASEPEVQWVVNQIEEFDPDVIVSVHAPYNLLDFEGPSRAPEKIGQLYLHQFGVYPGSLGNYAGVDKRIPVVTLELPSAGILPTREQIRLMWLDLVSWLDNEGRKSLAAH